MVMIGRGSALKVLGRALKEETRTVDLEAEHIYADLPEGTVADIVVTPPNERNRQVIMARLRLPGVYGVTMTIVTPLGHTDEETERSLDMYVPMIELDHHRALPEDSYSYHHEECETLGRSCWSSYELVSASHIVDKFIKFGAVSMVEDLAYSYFNADHLGEQQFDHKVVFERIIAGRAEFKIECVHEGTPCHGPMRQEALAGLSFDIETPMKFMVSFSPTNQISKIDGVSLNVPMP